MGDFNCKRCRLPIETGQATRIGRYGTEHQHESQCVDSYRHLLAQAGREVAQLTAQVERLRAENAALKMAATAINLSPPLQLAITNEAPRCPKCGQFWLSIPRLAISHACPVDMAQAQAGAPVTHVAFTSPADQSAWDECQGERAGEGGEDGT